MDLDRYKDFISEISVPCGALIRRYWDDHQLDCELKSDQTPVTEGDRQAESFLREQIAEQFPEHGIIGEEFPDLRPNAELVWILDPIDGTKSFISHVPLFGTLIGLLHHGKPILGAIHQPILGELMIGDHHTTTLNGQLTRVRSCEDWEDATVLMTDPTLLLQPNPGLSQALSRCRLVRSWGDCYGYLLLASGRADLMLDPVLSPWDLLPLIPIIRGAGGVITDWQGGDPTTGQSAIAGSPTLQAKALEALRP